MLEKTEGAIKNGQSRNTGSIGHIKRRAKTNKAVDILLTCGVHLHARIISLRGAVWVHNSSFTQELYTQVPVPSKESKRFVESLNKC
jgi:hypothetical protein